jgi:hypothetical protein
MKKNLPLQAICTCLCGVRYCARPCFASENLRWNGPWLIYRLSKKTYTGKTFIQLTPQEFLEKIAALIPIPHRDIF